MIKFNGSEKLQTASYKGYLIEIEKVGEKFKCVVSNKYEMFVEKRSTMEQARKYCQSLVDQKVSFARLQKDWPFD